MPAGQILHRDFGEVLDVSPAPKRNALGRVSARSVRPPARVRASRREVWMLRDADLDERLERLGYGR
jgi:hypothetical protein